MYIYIYTHVCMCMYIYIYIYIHTHTYSDLTLFSDGAHVGRRLRAHAEVTVCLSVCTHAQLLTTLSDRLALLPRFGPFL